MSARAEREGLAARYAAHMELDPAELIAAAEAVWGNLNPQSVAYEIALSVAAAALVAVKNTRREGTS